ncbi:MAG TPA: hypothetical protein ENG95_06860 [Nitrospirae bacterium]|nr:chaperone SurA [bacterium BMS3Abin10]GBE38159.1 chaperone SurA [bacterium BMS3Bbin08]HDH51452.1 hypothetical protein [Nitrospirota bacterium]HDK81988.1 hypothetical protein [Nitrospirota bacterium]HDO26345.1 hypothetical protein [Nitrospirota bacterium]
MKNRKCSISNKLTLVCVLLLTSYFLFPVSSYAEVIDRVVAVVDDEVVMLSEFNETLREAGMTGMEVTQDEVLDGLINRILLLREARKARRTHVFSARTKRFDNMLINEYIEKRVKAFIRVPYNEIELFYEDNVEFFQGENFFDVRDEIEAYLVETEVNKRLIDHINELREKAYIRKQLIRGD